MVDKVIADSMDINVSSTSCSEGLSAPFLITIANNDQISKYIYTTSVTPVGATKEGDKTIVSSASCIVGQIDSVQRVNYVPDVTNHPNNINPPLLEKNQINYLPLGLLRNYQVHTKTPHMAGTKLLMDVLRYLTLSSIISILMLVSVCNAQKQLKV
jgi:hypothetical protein